jgi:transposase-like protein
MGAITAELVETGEKRDRSGRRVTPAERRVNMVAAYRGSGLTMAAFARREGINYATFAGWVAKTQRSAPAGPAIKFAEVQLPARPLPTMRPWIEVQLPDGTMLRGERVAEVVQLLRALRG